MWSLFGLVEWESMPKMLFWEGLPLCVGGLQSKRSKIQENDPFFAENHPPVTPFFGNFFGLVEWELDSENLVHNPRPRVEPPRLRMYKEWGGLQTSSEGVFFGPLTPIIGGLNHRIWSKNMTVPPPLEAQIVVFWPYIALFGAI
jgi:hypothetical protein